MTTQDRTEEFKQRLFALMQEYGVVMTVREKQTGWESPTAVGVDFYSYENRVDLELSTYEDGKPT